MGRMKSRSGSAGRGGFTLVELLAVMAIMVLMMTLTMGEFIDWGRNVGMKGCIANFKSAMNGARQEAITKRVRTTVYYGNSKGFPPLGYYIVSNSTAGVIGQTNWLAKGVQFELTGTNYTCPITYKIDGSCTNGNGVIPVTIRLKELGRGTGPALGAGMQIYPLTGKVKVKED